MIYKNNDDKSAECVDISAEAAKALERRKKKSLIFSALGLLSGVVGVVLGGLSAAVSFEGPLYFSCLAFLALGLILGIIGTAFSKGVRSGKILGILVIVISLGGLIFFIGLVVFIIFVFTGIAKAV